MITGECLQIGHGRPGPSELRPDGWVSRPWRSPDGRTVVRRLASFGSRRGQWHYDGCECNAHVKHPFVLMDIDGKSVEIDEQIAELIAELNDAGVRTQFSCQGDASKAGMVLILTQEPELVGKAVQLVIARHERVEVKFNEYPAGTKRTLLTFPGVDAPRGQDLTNQ